MKNDDERRWVVVAVVTVVDGEGRYCHDDFSLKAYLQVLVSTSLAYLDLKKNTFCFFLR